MDWRMSHSLGIPWILYFLAARDFSLERLRVAPVS